MPSKKKQLQPADVFLLNRKKSTPFAYAAANLQNTWFTGAEHINFPNHIKNIKGVGSLQIPRLFYAHKKPEAKADFQSKITAFLNF